MTSSMTSSPWKNSFWHNWDDLFISKVNLKLCLMFLNFLNGRHFVLATFSLEVIPEVEYTRQIAISIYDIFSFWSTLELKYWRRYINLKIWPNLWPGDVINHVMNMYLQCSHNVMIPKHWKFNDDIFARFGHHALGCFCSGIPKGFAAYKACLRWMSVKRR